VATSKTFAWTQLSCTAAGPHAFDALESNAFNALNSKLAREVICAELFGRQTRRFDRDPNWRAASARLEQFRDRVLKEVEAGQKPQARCSSRCCFDRRRLTGLAQVLAENILIHGHLDILYFKPSVSPYKYAFITKRHTWAYGGRLQGRVLLLINFVVNVRRPPSSTILVLSLISH
jgi:hypothetical protein